MKHIFYVMGKSSSGKDTIYKELLSEEALQLSPIVLYTTRPIREGEKNGREYFFVSEDELRKMQEAGSIIESRTYHTVHGDWTYCTSSQGICLEEKDYIAIGTPQAYEKLATYYGLERLVPMYIEVDDGVRLQRALDRERQEASPRYEEMCRRFLADAQDFSEEVLSRLQLPKRFRNAQLGSCIEEMKEYIMHQQSM